MMKIAIISPPGEENRTTNPIIDNNPGLKNITFSLESIYNMPNITLITLAAILKPYFIVEIFDGEREKLPSINYFEKYDYVFFTGMSYQIDNGRKISSELQKMNIKTIAGGVHTTFNDESNYFDSVFIGELENNCDKFIEDLKNSNLKPVYNVKTPPLKIVDSPIPLYELIKKDEIFPVQLTRGCPYDCNFCIVTKGFGKILRIRPIEQIKKIINKIKSIDPNPGIFFTDDNMFLNRKFAIEILTYLETQNIRFMTHSDLDIAKDIELLKLLKKAGCYAIMAGIETTNPESLGEASKFKVKQGNSALKNIEIIQSHGIGIIGSFVVGFDHDDENTFSNIDNFIKDANLFEVCVKVLTPFPGTSLRNKLIKEERLTNKEFSKYTARELLFNAKNLEEDKIKIGIEKIIKEYTSIESRKKRILHFKNLMKKMVN